ncbi:GNAT family N-acetyltransferase [Streptomyces sp. LN699]|uniref:GNAT family N-acetyltransferase n=1 Tax=Streptomyces sp. LN699 TaxID=3112981 RepID=UPI0037214B2D
MGRPSRPAALHPENAWIHTSRGGPGGLAASGYGGAAFAEGAVLCVACSSFRGGAYEDIVVVTVPDRRSERLALACVSELTADVRVRGRTASWCCSHDDRTGRLLAWTAGFRLTREYVHHFTGRARVTARARDSTAVPT